MAARKIHGKIESVTKWTPAFVEVCGRRLEYRRIPAANEGAPTIVLLHEGLGSVSVWREFPQSVAERTGCGIVAYSRYGYGRSDVREGPLDMRYLHEEALDVLPQLLHALDIAEPILFGHSDGASIAIIHAGAGHRAKALILEAPHVFVEEISIAGVAAVKAAFESGEFQERFARHHANPERSFRAWSEAWLRPEFTSWNIGEYLRGVSCPVLAIQGFNDEYGTMAQLDAIAANARAPAELLKLEGCGHSPHRDRPDAVLDVVARFVQSLR